MLAIRLLPLATCVLIALTAAAQELSIGLHAGPTFGRGVYGDPDIDELSEPIAGYVLGVPFELAPEGPLSFQADVNLVQRGQRSTLRFGGLIFTDVQWVTRITYLETNLLAKAGLEAGDLSVAVVAGPSVAYALAGKTVQGDVSERIDWNRDDALRRADIGLAVGAQGSLSLGPGRALLDLRYRLGSSNLNGDDDPDAVSIRSRALEVRLGYLIPLR